MRSPYAAAPVVVVSELREARLESYLVVRMPVRQSQGEVVVRKAAGQWLDLGQPDTLI